jgi:hypothetical protein
MQLRFSIVNMIFYVVFIVPFVVQFPILYILAKVVDIEAMFGLVDVGFRKGVDTRDVPRAQVYL